MTVLARTLMEAGQIPAAATTQYTAPTGTRTLVDKMTVTNPSGSAATLTVALVQSGGAAGAANTVISAQSIGPGATYLCPEVVGHILNPGDFISTSASTGGVLVLRISGREVN